MKSTPETGFIIYMSSLSILGTISNFCILIVYRDRVSSNASIYLLFSLALVDLLISLIVVPFTIISSITEFYINDRFFCGLSYFLRYFSNSISVILLALIALERYNTISAKTMTRLRLLQKSLIYNSKRATVVAVVLCFILTVWCFYFIENVQKTCVPIDSFIYYNIICCITLAIILIIMIVLYVKSYLIVHRSTTKIFIKNLDSTQSNRAKKYSFMVKFDNNNTTNDECSKTSDKSDNNTQNQTETSSNEVTSKNDELSDPKNSMSHFYVSSNSNDVSLKCSNNVEIQQSTNSQFLLKSRCYSSCRTKRLNTINENQEIGVNDKDIKFNDIIHVGQMNDTYDPQIESNNSRSKFSKLSSKLFLIRSKETYKNRSLSEDSSDKEPKLTPIFIINNEINVFKTNEDLIRRDYIKREKPDIFKKRLSNLSISNSFIKKDWKVARMFSLVTAVFILTWIPWVIMILDLVQYDPILINLYFLNNIINPVIYSFLSKSFRRDFWGMILSFVRRKRSIYCEFCLIRN